MQGLRWGILIGEGLVFRLILCIGNGGLERDDVYV
jgi:hypothetical protein